MAIATLLFSTLVLKVTGNTGVSGMIGAIAIGSVICIVAAMAGDTSQDLKTGYILGATPKKQQIGELLGAVVAAFTIGGVLLLLNSAWGFGTTELAAPQATLMKMITEGVIRWIVDKKSADKNGEASGGVLFCSGLIAGEGLVGILLAILAVVGVSSKFDLSSSVNTGRIGGIVLLAIMIACVFIFAMPKKKVEK